MNEKTIRPVWLAVTIATTIVFLSMPVLAKERVKVLATGPQPGHYLVWDSKPILPIGDSTTQGWMESGVNFDQEGYLDALSSQGINVAMIWSYIATDSLKQIGDARLGYDAPEILPWQGSTQGNSANLQQFNQTYFDRLASFVSYAESKDILVLITVHDGWTKSLFNRHPFNASQGNGPLTDGSQYVELADYDSEMPTVFNPAWDRRQQNQYFQERFADKLITELEPYSNVIYEMFNEGEWYDHADRRRHEEHFLKFFRARTDALLMTNTDHIFGDDPHGNRDVDIVSLHGSSWTGEHNQFAGGFNSSPTKPYFMSEQIPDFNGQNVSLDDIRQGAWEQAMAGAGWVAQNDTSFSWDPNATITSQIVVRNRVYDQVGHVATFFNDLGVGFWRMAPEPALASTGVVLAAPGVEYLVYANIGGALTVDLSTADGKTLSVEWYNPRTGAMSAAPSIEGGLHNTPFTTPDGSDWVLRLKVHRVPEPTTLCLLAMAGGSCAITYRRRRLPRHKAAPKATSTTEGGSGTTSNCRLPSIVAQRSLFV